MHRDADPAVKCPICNSTCSVLSNLFPHPFDFYTSATDLTHCLSMESFIQSLRVKEPLLQKFICENYHGPTARNLKATLRDWREDGFVYWNGIRIRRDSPTYNELITTAYDCLFESNPVFREIVLPTFKDKFLIHSIGKDSKSDTLLTEQELCFQLNRLIQRLEPCVEI